MNVYWSFGPPPLRPLSPLAMTSRSVSSRSYGDPAPQSPMLKQQAPLRTPFLVTPPNPTIHSRPPLLLPVTALYSVSSLQPRILVSMKPLHLLIRKREPRLSNKRLNGPGMVKSTPSTSIQPPRSLVPPCYMLVCTTAWLPDSVYVSDLCP